MMTRPARFGGAMLAATILLGATLPALAVIEPTSMVQYFEAKWEVIRARMPDVFMAGYNATWVPPPQRGSSQTSSTSIGYDLFDRFDLGSDTFPTRYGTETEFRLMVDEFHRANCRVYVDWIMNHNATSDNSTPNFTVQGGYPGFRMTASGDANGDFHAPGTQSENPGGANFNLYEGRLLGLIDIAQEKTGAAYQCIRHPIQAGDPNNIPAGTLRNLPNANNRRFYPDQALTPKTFMNPSNGQNWTVYPYNTADPMQGDPTIEACSALLMRSTQYYLDVFKVDGFRLDAAKHIPTSWWNNSWDVSVHMRHIGFDGVERTPWSFVEAVGGPGIDPWSWARLDNFANRDILELDEAGTLRNQVDNPGSTGWDNALNLSYDNRDGGLNNGTAGLHHVSSHDNANSGSNLDTTAFAYAIMRSGPTNVYHNALQFGTNVNNFPRRNGRDDALGLNNDAITTLVRLRNQFVRGRFDVLNFSDTVNPSLADILIMQHSKDLGGGNLVGNVVIGVNDKQTNGPDANDQRSVVVAFPQGTRLHEQTGNAANPTVDITTNATDDVAEVLTVDASNRILIKVPRNRNLLGVNHGRGYVVYAPAVPGGSLGVTNVAYTIPADSAGVSDYQQRLTPIDVITGNSFEIQLTTTQGDALDPNTDDDAVFRLDSGFKDCNSNGTVDHGMTTDVDFGFEDFLTQSSPLYSNPGAGNGIYRQVINAAGLTEGYHYILAYAYRHRSDGGDPIFREYRKVFYLDRTPPQVQLVSPTATCNNDVTTLPLVITCNANDPTVNRVHIFVDLPVGTDVINLANLGANKATRNYLSYTRTQAGLTSGNHRLDVVSYETLPNGNVTINQQTFTGIAATTGTGLGAGDVTANGTIDGEDIASFIGVILSGSPAFNPAADMNCDGLCDTNDIPGLLTALLN